MDTCNGMIAVIEIHVKTCRQKHTSCQSDAAETAATATFLLVFTSCAACFASHATATVEI